MAVDVAVLAATLVGKFLVPYLKVGVEGISERVRERFSDVAATHVGNVATKVWQQVAGLFRGTPDEHTLTLFEADPDGLTKTVERRLEQVLREQPSLAEELAALIEAQSPDGAGSGARIIGASVAGIVDARGATIHGGQVAGVILGVPAPAEAPGPDQPAR